VLKVGVFMDYINWKYELLPFEQAVDELVLKFKAIRREFIRTNKHSPIDSVTGRVKSVASIIEKSNRRGIPITESLEKLEDIAGIRIMCRFVEDIYKVADYIRHRSGSDMRVIQEEDYIKNYKSSGYRSYHITIAYPMATLNGSREYKCEIQIRTMAMNFWATIEHSLRYKYDGNIPDELKIRLQNCADAAFQLDEEMTTIRSEIMEAQRAKQTKKLVVDEIVENIHNLYTYASLDKMNEFNRKFLVLCQEDSLEKYVEFNKQLETIAKIYNVKYVD
jgi:putative GTP pyrophosphokinase